MSKSISKIKPNTIQDYIIKYDYAFYLMNQVIEIEAALRCLEGAPSTVEAEYTALLAAFAPFKDKMYEYKSKQQQSLVDYVEDKS